MKPGPILIAIALILVFVSFFVGEDSDLSQIASNDSVSANKTFDDETVAGSFSSDFEIGPSAVTVSDDEDDPTGFGSDWGKGSSESKTFGGAREPAALDNLSDPSNAALGTIPPFEDAQRRPDRD